MVLAQLKLEEPPKEVEMYNINSDQMEKGIDTGWLVCLYAGDCLPEGQPHVKIPMTNLALLAIRDVMFPQTSNAYMNKERMEVVSKLQEQLNGGA